MDIKKSRRELLKDTQREALKKSINGFKEEILIISENPKRAAYWQEDPDTLLADLRKSLEKLELRLSVMDDSIGDLLETGLIQTDMKPQEVIAILQDLYPQ